jgi:hypothetical protein
MNPTPNQTMANLINSYWLTGAICAAARLGVADQLAAGPRTADDLAKATGTHAPSLLRLLRALAANQIFIEGPAGSFALTPLAEVLRGGVPGSLRGLATMSGMLHLHAWPEILHSVRTGETAFSAVFGKEVWEHVTVDAEAGAAFDEAMAGYTAGMAAALVAGFDFSGYRQLVDVGGGNGALLAAICARHAELRGVSFDLPAVAERARAHLAKRGLADRCQVAGGDFFESVPAGGDAYLMKMILHDWDDERSIALLKVVRAHNAPVLVMEAVLEPGNNGPGGKLLDLNMLVMTGGRERTAEEYAALFRAAGFALDRVVTINPLVSVIVARPV